MKLKFVLGSASLLASSLAATVSAHADTFDVRKNAERSNRSDMPTARHEHGAGRTSATARRSTSCRPPAAMRRVIRRSIAGAITATPCISSAAASSTASWTRRRFHLAS